MGGKAAKERRRNQRLLDQNEKAVSTTANALPLTDLRPTKGGEKVKKPKHLKRKLENAAIEEERKRLLIAKEAWDAAKSVFSHQLKKKQKVTDITSSGNFESAAKAKPHHATVENKKNIKPKDLGNVDRLDTKSERKRILDVPHASKGSKTTLYNQLEGRVDKETNRSAAPAINACNLAANPPQAAPSSDSKSTTADGNIFSPDSLSVYTGIHVDRHDDDDKSGLPNSDFDDVAEPTTRRQRGGRRRGRPNTEQYIRAARANEANEIDDKHQADPEKALETTDPSESTSSNTNSKRRDKKEYDKRYCVGRKPVTDFAVGQRYSCKVVYVKPFGAFLDIGCHSDAFCHVSRLRDDFVDSATEAVQEGDLVQARVIEIDRKQKRITVSLQSDARIEDERASIDARQERRAKLATKKNKQHNKALESTFIQDPIPGSFQKGPLTASTTPPLAPVDDGGPAKNKKQNKSLESISSQTPIVGSFQKGNLSSFTAPSQAQADDKGPASQAELKRARKLARRAERRAQFNNVTLG